ncbi:MAG: complex I subunit 4 family protein [Anaerolineae bacterium]
MNFPILSAITFIPLLGAVLCLLIPKEDEQTIKRLSTGISVIPLVLAGWLWFAYNTTAGGMQFEEVAVWIPAIDVHYHVGVDGLSVPLVFLTTFLTTLSLFYSSYTIKNRVKEFFFLFLLLEMGMLGVFVSLDFILFYVFWEVGLVPMYLLIGIWGQPKDRPQYAAIKFFLYTLAGSVFMLLAIIGIYLTTGSFDILEAAKAQPFADNFALAAAAFWAFFVAFAIKVPSFPFHTWLPDAHTAAPTAGSVILAGILLKLGAYGMIRIVLPVFPTAFQFYAPIVAALAVISIVYGALVCMAQWDLKRLIAYSSVSHMGYVMLGIAAAAASLGLAGSASLNRSATIALNGAALQMFNHGIITGGLFFLVGVIYERAHIRDLKAFGGLGAKLPYFYGIMAVTGLASLGLPGLAGFWSEFFVFRGAFAIIPVFAVIGILGVVVTAAYILWKIIQYVFLGPFNEEKWGGLTDMAAFEKITMWPLVLFMVFFGIWPTPIVNLLNSATSAILAAL